MRKIPITFAYLLTMVFLAGGCWATRDEVQKELNRTKTEMRDERTKQLDEKIAQISKKIESINNRIDNDIMPKIAALDSKAYTNQQNIAKILEEQLTALKKEITEIKSRLNDIEANSKK